MKNALLALLLLAAPAFAIEGVTTVKSKTDDGSYSATLNLTKAQFDSLKVGDTIDFDKPVVDPPDEPDPPVGNLDPTKAPGQNFDLAPWKLTLPVDSKGAKTGKAAEVSPIPATYKNAQWFTTGPDGSMVFSCPTDGAKTSSGTAYARSELREMVPGGDEIAWTVAQGGTLKATCAILEMPVATGGDLKRSRVVVGQIHGPDDELCRLYYEAGKVYYGNDKSPTAEKFYDLKDSQGRVSAIPLGAKFDYTIQVAAGKLTVSATHGGVVYSASETISSFWNGKGLYYKAGMYCQVGKPGSSAGSTGTGTGTAAFYALSVSH